MPIKSELVGLELVLIISVAELLLAKSSFSYFSLSLRSLELFWLPKLYSDPFSLSLLKFWIYSKFEAHSLPTSSEIYFLTRTETSRTLKHYWVFGYFDRSWFIALTLLPFSSTLLSVASNGSARSYYPEEWENFTLLGLGSKRHSDCLSLFLPTGKSRTFLSNPGWCTRESSKWSFWYSLIEHSWLSFDLFQPS
jgi:hypothetical protein